MRKTILTLSAAAVALTGAGIAYAQRGDRPNPDANGDGVATLAEVKAHGNELFAKLDANGDGVINAQDRQAHHEEMFAKADANGDGELSQAEMKAMHEARKERREERREARAEKREARMAEHFAKMDTDNSGGLSQDELRAMHEARGERHEGRRGGKRGMRGGHGERGAHMMLKMADKDGDKSVTRAEFDAGLAAHFAKVDTDGDGAISAEEREAAHKAMRAEWKAKREERRAQ
ncbi:MAG: EF-hand domain-containing protein [Erythrobacter sp.]